MRMFCVLKLITKTAYRLCPSVCRIEMFKIGFYFYLQRQDTDERLRRLQTEKESMALQVQVLTEQVSAQSDKIADLERIILDKTQQLSHSEDLLQRVSYSQCFIVIGHAHKF